MVLSNKKLKQKLRSTLAGTLADSVAGNTSKESTKKKEESNSQVQSLKELLGSATQKPRLSKREIRRKKLPLPSSKTVEGESGDLSKKETTTVSVKKEITIVSEGSNDKKKKKKKRKREEGEGKEKENGVVESAEKKAAEKEKKAAIKAKKKRARKEKNKIKKRDNNKVVENKGENKEEPVTSVVQIDESYENVDVPSKVYVGGIPYYSSEDDIRSFFESCGTITEMDCMTFPETGKFRGIAMITFKTEAAAKRALALDGADMGGFFLKIQPYKTARAHKAPPSSDFAPKIIEGYNRVYVGNLAWDITEDDLKKLFADFNVSKIRFGMDKESGEFRGYAHVDFTDFVSVSLALKLDQTEVCGRPARITCAVPKKDVKDRPISEPSNKKAENENTSNKKAENENTSNKKARYENLPVIATKVAENPKPSSDGGKKRRTCYECGVPGHISSDCPKKKAADAVVASSKPEYEYHPTISNGEANENPPVIATKVAENPKPSSDGGKKRRTCYECGVPGHISSDCPKKKAADAVVASSKPEYEYPTRSNGAANENPPIMATKVAENPKPSSGSGKKRRTCYECGVAGHISSDCPKKKAADAVAG